MLVSQPDLELEDFDDQSLAEAILSTDVPSEYRIIAPDYFIDYVTNPAEPIYFESGMRYPIRYNAFTGSFFTFIGGYRLITFRVVDGDLLVKNSDLNLHEHLFTFADIFTPEMLIELVSQHQYAGIDEIIELLDVPDLLTYADNEMNLENVLAEVFGKPLFQWVWRTPGYDYGIEIVNHLGVKSVCVVDEEVISGHMSSKRNRRLTAEQLGMQQLGFNGMDWDISIEA